MMVSPRRALDRIRSRYVADLVVRRYEAASKTARTQKWGRSSSDANSAILPAAPALRELSRDLARNNPWVRRGKAAIADKVVGWGITPSFSGGGSLWGDVWDEWANTTQCDADGRVPFSGLQRLVMSTVAESGEALVRIRRRRPSDGLALPLQLQVLEPDRLDASHDTSMTRAGGKIVGGIETNAIGRRVAYWLFREHPGSAYSRTVDSVRVPATNVLHVFHLERAEQTRGEPWFASVISRARELDSFEDAELVRQKVAASFAAFVSSVDGVVPEDLLGEANSLYDDVTTIEPGTISHLSPGESISFATPPVSANQDFAVRSLRSIAAGIGTTYEELTGDYSQVNYSSARMARLDMEPRLADWRWNMLIPQFCDPVFREAVTSATLSGVIGSRDRIGAKWTEPGTPLLDPDKEIKAYRSAVRTGAMTPSDVVRAQGRDPARHWDEYKQDLARLDKAGIWLDADARRLSASGVAHSVPAAQAPAPGGDDDDAEARGDPEAQDD